MDTIKLNITRKKQFLSSALSYSVYFNDKEIVKLPNGRGVSLEVPADKKFMLTVSIYKKDSLLKKLTPHSGLTSKTVMIHPEYCKNGVVDCIITTQIDMLGSMSFGWLRPMSEIDVTIDYKQ